MISKCDNNLPRFSRWMYFKAVFVCKWHELVSRHAAYKYLMFRLRLLRRIFRRDTGIALFTLEVRSDKYHYKIYTSNFFTDPELNNAHGFVCNLLHNRVKKYQIQSKANSIIEETNKILNNG